MRIPDQPIQMQFRSVRRRFRGRHRRAVGPVDVAALLNVVLLLGMFVFAGQRFVLQPGVRVRLPEAPFADGAAHGTRVLTVTQEGMMFYNDERTDLGRLEGALGGGAEGWEKPLLIEADEGTSYGTLVEIYARAIRAGVREVVLATRPPAVEP